MRLLVVLLAYVSCGGCTLWPQGVVHYAINKKDYDVHSQDEITSVFARLQNEICVKFFKTPTNYSASPDHKVLYISNTDKRKDCPPTSYDFTKSVVDMPIGYRCINQKEIARILVEMLRASIEQTVLPFNSYDLIKKFKEREDSLPRHTLLSPADRNFINAHYHSECGALNRAIARRSEDAPASEDASAQMSVRNARYYSDKRWPLAVVMYAVHPAIPPNDPDLLHLKHAMETIELSSCVVFQRIASQDLLEPKNFLWLSTEGEDMPHLGFLQGNQTLNLKSLASGAPGHIGHALHVLLRLLGVPMMSNRYDRDNYITVNWKNVAPGKEHYLEKSPEDAWLQQIPYDFSSATHAPANYMCRDCADPLASRTVLPLQDPLWQRTLSMGRRVELSDSDAKLLAILYGEQCRNRLVDATE